MKQKTKGRPRNEETTERVYIRVPQSMLIELKRLAKSDDRSLSSFLRKRLEESIQQPK